MEPWKIFVAGFMALNLLAYILMCFDKYRSRRGGRRIPENTLFMMALAFGATGIYAGMKAPLYHKAAKPKFKYGVPLLIAFNALLICFLIA
jgi:uncharacterized membrane protein YsdA (DUF1294 family)